MISVNAESEQFPICWWETWIQLICYFVRSWKCKCHMAVFIADENLNGVFCFVWTRPKKNNLTCPCISTTTCCLWGLHDGRETLSEFLAVLPLRARVLLRLDEDVNGPLSSSFLLLISWALALVLTHLLLCWSPDGPEPLSRGHFGSCCWTISLQLVNTAALWTVLLFCAIGTKDIGS